MTRENFEEVIKNIEDSVRSGSITVPPHYDYKKAIAGVKSYVAHCLASESEAERTFLDGSAASLSTALYDMLTLGLSLHDKSCYLFRKSRKTGQYTLRRSYYGTEKIIRELYPDSKIFAAAVYEGEQFNMGRFVNGKPIEISHYPDLECMNKGNIIASYAVILDKDDKVIGYSIINTTALANIKLNGGFVNPVWKTYPEEMAKKSAINRACKTLVNSIPAYLKNDQTDEMISSFNRSGDNDVVPSAIDDEDIENMSESPENTDERKEPEGNAVEKVLKRKKKTTAAATDNTATPESATEKAEEPVKEVQQENDDTARAEKTVKAEEDSSVRSYFNNGLFPPQNDWRNSFYSDNNF